MLKMNLMPISNKERIMSIRIFFKKLGYKIKNFISLFKPRTSHAFLIVFFLLAIIFLKTFTQLLFNEKLNPVKIFLETCPEVIFAICVGLAVNLFENTIMTMLRPRPSVDAYFEDVKTKLCLFGYTLNDFHKKNDLSTSVITFFEQQKTNLSSAGKLQKNQFQFLLLDPFTDEFEKRAKFENKDKNILRFECAKSVRAIKKIKNDLIVKELISNGNDNDSEFAFKFYNVMPSHSLIITDTIVWVGPFIYRTAGTTSIWYQIKESLARNEYIQEFDTIWNEKTNSYYESEILNGSEPIDPDKKRDENKKLNYQKLMLIPKILPRFLNEIMRTYEENKKLEITDDQFKDICDIACQIAKDNLKIEIRHDDSNPEFFSLTYNCETGLKTVVIQRHPGTRSKAPP